MHIVHTLSPSCAYGAPRVRLVRSSAARTPRELDRVVAMPWPCRSLAAGRVAGLAAVSWPVSHSCMAVSWPISRYYHVSQAPLWSRYKISLYRDLAPTACRIAALAVLYRDTTSGHTSYSPVMIQLIIL